VRQAASIVRIELHCHSTHSDGSFPADEVARRAKRTRVRLFCLTDHDTCAGFAATRDELADDACVVMRGLELSCRAFDRTVHVLLYGLQEGPELDALQGRLDEIHVERRERLLAICARLDKLGIHLDAQAILTRTHGRTAGRPDVARALVEAGVCKTPQDAFTRYLRDGGPADVQLGRLGVEEGLALARPAGARASLAHPHTLGDPSLVRLLFERHKAHGLEGLEACYGGYAWAESEGWLRLAAALDLVVTGGSDFHGEMSPMVTQPGIELAEPHAQRLCDWLGVVASA
jgi:3',5'-nucleoside bisphosphate phosphatase